MELGKWSRASVGGTQRSKRGRAGSHATRERERERHPATSEFVASARAHVPRECIYARTLSRQRARRCCARVCVGKGVFFQKKSVDTKRSLHSPTKIRGVRDTKRDSCAKTRALCIMERASLVLGCCGPLSDDGGCVGKPRTFALSCERLRYSFPCIRTRSKPPPVCVELFPRGIRAQVWSVGACVFKLVGAGNPFLNDNEVCSDSEMHEGPECGESRASLWTFSHSSVGFSTASRAPVGEPRPLFQSSICRNLRFEERERERVTEGSRRACRDVATIFAIGTRAVSKALEKRPLRRDLCIGAL